MTTPFQNAVEVAERIIGRSNAQMPMDLQGDVDSSTFRVWGDGGHAWLKFYADRRQVVCEVNDQIRARSRNGSFVGTVGAREVVEGVDRG